MAHALGALAALEHDVLDRGKGRFVLGLAAGRGAVRIPVSDPPRSTARVSLVDHNLWERLDADQDPFEDRPDQPECAQDAVKVEVLGGEVAYGVDTGPCHYITARQATQKPVSAGDTIRIRLWHFTLNAPSPAQAHAVVELDGLRLLDERVPIPQPGGLLSVEVIAETGIEPAAPVFFHLHNHGDNSWALVEISTGP